MPSFIPIVSVYMTARNGMPHIRTAIASIQSQTLSQWELVVVDDASDDETYDFVLSLCRQDNRIKLFKSGFGRSRSLRMAVENCSAELIANLDADDLMHPLRLEIQSDYFKKSESLALNSTDAIIIDNRETEFDGSIKKGVVLKKITSSMLAKRNVICHSTVMMRRSAYIVSGGYDENRISQIDYELWLRMITKGFEMNLTNLKLGAKRVHSRQSFENKKRIKYLLSSLRLQLHAIQELRMSKIYLLIAYCRFFYGMFPQMLRTNIRKIGSLIMN